MANAWNSTAMLRRGGGLIALRGANSGLAVTGNGGTRQSMRRQQNQLHDEQEGAMAKLDWRRARLFGRQTLDHRFENGLPDRAEKWLQAVQRNQAQRRQRPREYSIQVSISRTRPP